MGQEIRGVSEDPSLTAERAARDGDSIGRYLARQRKLRGVSLDELAAQTRIPRRSLERLEDGAFDRQSDGFARGFVRTVAAALGLDTEDAVMRLLDEPPPDERSDDRRGLALQRWAAATLLLVSCLAAVVGLRALSTGGAAVTAESAAGEIVYRRDAVRELAAAVESAAARGEPLDSYREGLPD